MFTKAGFDRLHFAASDDVDKSKGRDGNLEWDLFSADMGRVDRCQQCECRGDALAQTIPDKRLEVVQLTRG